MAAGLAPSAVDTARHKARQRDRATRFLRHDARNLADLGESFDAVLDCGLFHVFGDGDRPPTPATCGPRWRPCGRYFLLCCSDTQRPAARHGCTG
jgi:hypothetical protein